MRLEVKGLSKHYGDVCALRDLSMTAEKGVYALLGPNGSGKTTLMNIITQNLACDEGEVLWDGQPASALGASFREILGYMPQQQQVYPRFTVERFLYYIAALKDLDKAEASRQIDELTALCNLSDQRKKRLGALSGGMKQRVLIAQALLGQPELIILDEPTAGLDPKERVRVRNLVAQIGLDRIVIIATHIVSDIELIAREAIFLQKGVIAEQGTVGELLGKMAGSVWSVAVHESDVESATRQYRVVNITRQDDGVNLRVISDAPVENGVLTTPTLEDMYMRVFGDAE